MLKRDDIAPLRQQLLSEQWRSKVKYFFSILHLLLTPKAHFPGRNFFDDIRETDSDRSGPKIGQLTLLSGQRWKMYFERK